MTSTASIIKSAAAVVMAIALAIAGGCGQPSMNIDTATASPPPPAPAAATDGTIRVFPSIQGLTELAIPPGVDANRFYEQNYGKDLYYIDSVGVVSVDTGGGRYQRDRNPVLAAEDGTFIGRDNGEWGGDLSFEGETENYQVMEDNVRGIVRMGNDIYVVTGLAHLSMDYGAVIKLEKTNGKWQPVFSAALNGRPDAFTVFNDKMYLASYDWLAEFDGKEVKQLSDGSPWGRYRPLSIYVDEKIIALGVIGSVAIIDRSNNSAKRYTLARGGQIFTLYISVSPKKSGTVSPAGALKVRAGTKIDITAASNEGYLFDNWGASDITPDDYWPLSQSGLRIAVNRDMTLTAHFKRINVVSGSFTDPRDGREYRTVDMGGNTWMAQNLNYEIDGGVCYGEGDSVSSYDRETGKHISTKLSDAEARANCEKYGRLYDWNTAMQACPPGWSLPGEADWRTLFNAAGGSDVAGMKLKSNTGWDGTDDFGFSALPGGHHTFRDNSDSYSDENTFEKFYELGEEGSWWNTGGGRSSYFMATGRDFVGTSSGEMSENKYSARCVMIRDASAARLARAAGSVNTPPPTLQNMGTFTDSRDGKTYATVRIGSATWMAQNLNHKTGNSWCYRNRESYCDRSGRLYNWEAATKACPAGWRLPDTTDWNGLARTVGGQRGNGLGNSYDDDGKWEGVGGQLKSADGWNLNADGSSGGGTNDFGFSALPGGRRYDWTGGVYSRRGSYAVWWSATIAHYTNPFQYSIVSSSADLNMSSAGPNYGYSVRCVRE